MTNILPLDDFRYAISYHPYHFWQLANDIIPVTSKCNSLVKEYAWQDADAAGRADVRDAIQTAESRLREHLKFNVGVHFVEETVPYPKMKNPRMMRYANVDPRGRRIPVQLPEGEIIAVGKETRLSIDPGSAVVLTDTYGDGVDDTFTLTVNIAGVDVDEDQIAVYFAAADRLDGEAVSEKWRVAPIKVTFSGNTATIIGRSWLIVEPVRYQGVTASPIDPNVNGNFVSTLAVFKRYSDPDGTTVDNSQAVLIWESHAGLGCSSLPNFATCCSGLTFATGESDPYAEGFAIARAGIRNAKLGYVTPGEVVLNDDGTWSEISWSGCREPDKVLVRYQAGIEYDNNGSLQNGSSWKTIISRLAAAELMRPICGCDQANQELYRWQFDLARAAGANDEQYQISEEDLNNPLGLTRQGAVYAWKQIKNLRQTRAYLP